MQHTIGSVMSENDIFYEGDTVNVAGRRWTAPAPVVDAARVGDTVVLVLDPASLLKQRAGQAQNLRGYTVDGDELWTAEHPTHTSADCYTKIIGHEPLRVVNFAGYTCRIEARSGRLVESEFTK